MTEPAGSALDQALQHKLLVAMRSCFPELLRRLPEGVSIDDNQLDANLLYLEEHGLCDSGLSPIQTGGYAWKGAMITARGMDFLEEDGGLSAILGVLVVRLHADTVRDLIAAKIDAAPVSEHERSALRKHLAGLSEMTLRSATTDLVKSGLDHIPNVVTWLRTLAGL